MLRKVADTLERYVVILKEEHLEQDEQKDEAFERVRAEFAKEADKRQQAVDAAGEALDHAFDFMEDAFGDSQEMVCFVTELNTNYYSIQYLKENDCDKYFKYNKGLLFDERREKILEELEEMS